MNIVWKRFIRLRNPNDKMKGPEESGRRYDIPRWGMAEYLKILCEGSAIFFLFAYCFYHSLLPWLLFPLFLVFYYRYRRKQAVAHRREQLRRQFRDGMLSISSALQIGYSLENAVAEAAGEMSGLWGKNSDIYLEFAGIARGIHLNQPVEILFYEFAGRSQIEEILLFAEVLRNAKRAGGNLIQITKETAGQLGEKIRIQQEIRVSLAASRMQERIMCVSPLLILLYIQLTAPDLLAGMYGNLSGIIIMTICLGIYLTAIWMVQRIAGIPV